MKYNILLGMLMALIIASCSPSGHGHEHHGEHEGHEHSSVAENHEEHKEHEAHEGKEHEEHGLHESHEHDGHEEVKFQYTAYSDKLELFAEADAFIVGKEANVLSHFSVLPSFKAVEKGKMTIILNINGKETSQSLNEPTRKGIYSFNITPETEGTGTLKYKLETKSGTYEIVVSKVSVFDHKHEAHEAAEALETSEVNTTVFTKEQSWKIEFATAMPSIEPFGQVIKTTAMVQSSQGKEMVISAKTNGIVLFNEGVLLEGRDVTAGQALFTVSGSNLADDNIGVKYAEAKSNYERANAEYERAKKLSKDMIVSEKELLAAKNEYETTKAVYSNLSKNFNPSGQTVTSPQAGFIKQVFAKNGAYVEAGQPIAVVSQNNSLVLYAEVSPKYSPSLANIKTANIHSGTNELMFTLEQLHGKVLSYGKAANTDNYLIPVSLQVENNGNFVSGNFVEIYLKTFSNNNALVVPTSSLLEEQGNFFVWVQKTPELFEKREVFIGETDGIHTEIKKGIEVSERIVTRGVMLIKLAQSTGALDAHSGHVH